ncbi:response regulator transcription factor [Lachnotalea sp. AF33-28]|jgi:two-component system response regulator YesN|uniref:response regulator transcription factor n=1 Tax=Lachnotalea sp. AF33-28 TaxID=2292046 RepID=UPI000E482CBD|nr:response regulator [Lachnotalea sp. AF33-28]RHP34853.1 response regulator [Lachnotalea sp. AF33-28]
MYRLLIIDDEEKIREGIANLFPWNNIGFEIAGEYSNGEDALEYIAAHPVDVVFTDICMPVMDGICLSSILMEKNIKVVYFSSYQNFEYAQSALRNQVVDYLVKPIKYDELVSCFERVKKMLDGERRFSSVSEQPAPDNAADETYYQAIIRTVTDYLKENYREAALEEAAALVSLSPSYLSRLFTEKTGRHFTDHLLQIRMEKALAMMKDISYRQYEIAYRIGYDNPKNFSRAFKAYYGVTPQEYRNNPGILNGRKKE